MLIPILLITLINITGYRKLYFDDELFLAIRKNNTRLAMSALNSGADPNSKGCLDHCNEYRLLPWQIIPYLYDNWPGREERTEQLYTPLMVAADRNNDRLVVALLKRGGKVNLLSKIGTSALYYAVIRNNRDIVRLLLQYGANPNVHFPLKSDISLLDWARSNSSDSHEIIYMLVKYGGRW